MLPFPVGDENPTSRRPLVNLALIAINGGTFLWFNVHRGHGFFEMNAADLNAWGLRPGDPTPSRFLTAMFLHAGPMHLFGNMWFLHIFGDNVEDKLGRWKYLLLYLLWGVAASMAFLQFGRPNLPLSGAGAVELERAWLNLPLIGASGAIAGVMGAYLVFFPRARIRVVWWLIVTIRFFIWPALMVIGMFFLQDFILAAIQRSRGIGGVAYAAHVGGMVAGVAAALLLKPFLPKGERAADSAWDRDTGFAARGGDGKWGGGGTLDRSGLPDLRDQIVGAVLDGRMELAVDLYREWARTPAAEALPAAVEMEIAHEIVRLGRVEEASAAYRRYIERDPKGAEAAEAKFRLGLIYARVLGDREAARTWLKMAADEHKDPETASFARRELARLDRGS